MIYTISNFGLVCSFFIILNFIQYLLIKKKRKYNISFVIINIIFSGIILFEQVCFTLLFKYDFSDLNKLSFYIVTDFFIILSPFITFLIGKCLFLMNKIETIGDDEKGMLK